NAENNLGNTYLGLNRLVEAERSYQRAVDLSERLAKDFPAVIDFQEGEGVALTNLGIFLVAERRFREARPVFQRGVADYQRIVDRLPGHAQYRGPLEAARFRLAQVSGDRAAAEASNVRYDRLVTNPYERYSCGCYWACCAGMLAGEAGLTPERR